MNTATNKTPMNPLEQTIRELLEQQGFTPQQSETRKGECWTIAYEREPTTGTNRTPHTRIAITENKTRYDLAIYTLPVSGTPRAQQHKTMEDLYETLCTFLNGNEQSKS